jgi:hypothetical protein
MAVRGLIAGFGYSLLTKFALIIQVQFLVNKYFYAFKSGLHQ